MFWLCKFQVISIFCHMTLWDWRNPGFTRVVQIALDLNTAPFSAFYSFKIYNSTSNWLRWGHYHSCCMQWAVGTVLAHCAKRHTNCRAAEKHQWESTHRQKARHPRLALNCKKTSLWHLFPLYTFCCSSRESGCNVQSSSILTGSLRVQLSKSGPIYLWLPTYFLKIIWFHANNSNFVICIWI